MFIPAQTDSPQEGIGDLMAEGGIVFATNMASRLFMGVKGMAYGLHPQAFDAWGCSMPPA